MRASLINTGSPTHAVCKACEQLLPVTEYPARNDRSGRYRPYCKTCARNGQRARYANHKRESPFKLKLSRARSRSQYLKVPFNLTVEHLEAIWTGVCPVLDIPISITEKSRTDEFAAELDRFIPSLGYTVGNVTFLSRRANRLKNNTTSRELAQLLDWMVKHENRSDHS